MELAERIVDMSRAMHARDEARREFCELCPGLASWTIDSFRDPEYPKHTVNRGSSPVMHKTLTRLFAVLSADSEHGSGLAAKFSAGWRIHSRYNTKFMCHYKTGYNKTSDASTDPRHEDPPEHVSRFELITFEILLLTRIRG